VIRGERGGEKHLAYNAAVALLKWTFENAPLKEITLGVLSNNVQAVNLYGGLGFIEVNRHTLTRVNGTDTITFGLDQQNGTPESFQYVRMRLARDQWGRRSAFRVSH